ncbi:MAG: hypothetical protein NT154_00485 [Verrucomicrobia bacterium]|nr:hypothetical protein [Verrucomicrobiota bacterium]
MNGAHFHLLINHIPVLGTFFGLALLAFAAWKRSNELRKAAFGTFVVAALAAVATYLTGEPAEDVVKGMAGISAALIERHDNAAGIALGGAIALGVLALGGLIWFRGGKPIRNWFSTLALAAAILVTGLMAWTANLGGQIRHSEIRSGAASMTSSPGDRP